MDLQRPQKRFIPVTSFLLNIEGTQITFFIRLMAQKFLTVLITSGSFG